MATSLATQLSKIAANTSDYTDLKAARKKHAKSLLFEKSIAINQSFDEIYSFCVEGYNELTIQDPKFYRFRQSLFSEASKSIEREQLTQRESDDLDVIIENCLQIVQSHLQRTPGHKVLEWLIRRFKILEYNAIPTIFACLPYSTTGLFHRVMMLLPDNTSELLRFTAPYKKAGQPIVRHAIIAALSTSSVLLVRFTRFVVDACQKGYSHHELVCWWASAAAQALTAHLDNAKSGRSVISQQRQQDVLVWLLPILNSALPLKQAPDLQVAAYVLVCVLASKVQLDDAVLVALMETIAREQSPKIAKEALKSITYLRIHLSEESFLIGTQVRRLLRAQQSASELVLAAVPSDQNSQQQLPSTFEVDLFANRPFEDEMRALRNSVETESGSYLGEDPPLSYAHLISISNKIRKDFPKDASDFVGSIGDFSTQNSNTTRLSAYCVLWCHSTPVRIQLEAIKSATIVISQIKADYQALYPYIIIALRSPVKEVRVEIAALIRQLVSQGVDKDFWAIKDIYHEGSGATENLKWLSHKESKILLKKLLVSRVEECILDPQQIDKVIVELLAKSKKRKRDAKGETAETLPKETIINFLNSHAENTSLWSLKIAMMEIKAGLLKEERGSHGSAFSHLHKDWMQLQLPEAQKEASNAGRDLKSVDQVAAQCLSTANPDDSKLLQESFVDVRPTLRNAASERLRSTWSSLNQQRQTEWMKWLLKIASSSENRDSVGLARETLGSLQFHTQSTAELVPYLVDELLSKATAEKGPQKKFEVATALQPLTILMETINDISQSKDRPTLDTAYAVLQRLPASIASHQLDFLKGIAVEIIQSSLERISLTAEDLKDLDPQVIVDFMHGTKSRQLQTTSLLILIRLATIIPEKITAVVMPILSLVASEVVNMEDEFSDYIVGQVLEKVIPPLITAYANGSRGIAPKPEEAHRVIFEALPHIPMHRQVPLLKALTDNFGAEEYLPKTLVSHIEVKGVSSVAVDLIASYDVDMGLNAVEKLLAEIHRNRDEQSESGVYQAALNITHDLLTGKKYQHRLRQAFAEESTDRLYNLNTIGRILEWTIQRYEASNEDAETSEHEVLEEIFQDILHVLATKLLVQIVEGILAIDGDGASGLSDILRQKLLRIIELRLIRSKSDDKKAGPTCIEFMTNSLTQLKNGKLQLSDAYLRCWLAIINNYGRTNREAVINVSRFAITQLAGDSHPSIIISCLQILTSSVLITTRDFTPLLRPIFGFVELSTPTSAALSIARIEILTAVMTTIPALTTSTHFEAALLCVCTSATSTAEIGAASEAARLELLTTMADKLELSELMTRMASGIAVLAQHMPASSFNTSILEYNTLYSLATSLATRETAVEAVEVTFAMLRRMLDLRAEVYKHSSLNSPDHEVLYDDAEMSETENQMFDVTLKFILKLDDRSLRPQVATLFENLVNNESEDRGMDLCRQTTFFRFFTALSDRLKGLITSYAGIILDDTLAMMKRLTPVPNATLGRKRKSKKRDLAAEPEPESGLGELKQHLRQSILRALNSSFSADESSFWQNPAYFSAVAPLLVAYLVPVASSGDGYNEAEQKKHTLHFITEHVTPAILALATAVDSKEHYKSLNSSLIALMKPYAPTSSTVSSETRENNSDTRIAAVRTQKALVEGLGNEWCEIALSEMLPLLAEGLEEDDERVEVEVRALVAEIEEVMGESLGGMLV